MKRLVRLLVTTEAFLSKVALGLSMAALVALSLTCLWQVVARAGLGWPIEWAEPSMRYLMIWSAFLAMPTAFRSNAMISMDFFASNAGGLRRLIVPFVALCCVGFLALCVYAGLQILPRVARQQIVGLRGITMFWAYLPVAIGSALSILAIVCRLIRPAGDDSGPGRIGETA